jgi:hypothetical protein
VPVDGPVAPVLDGTPAPRVAIILVGLGRAEVEAPTGPRGVGDISFGGSFLGGRVDGAIEWRLEAIVFVKPGSFVAATAPGREGLGTAADAADVICLFVVVALFTGGTAVPFAPRVVEVVCALAFCGRVVVRVTLDVCLTLGDCLGVADVDFSVPAGNRF